MSSDKRSVTTDALDTLGSIISENEKRDAIHLAVENVRAGENLRPGSHVGFLPNGSVGISAKKHVGIVDPFISGPVKPGMRFWLVVYPRQITSLRHVWTHPDFPDAELNDSAPKGKSASEKWMRAWAMEHMSDNYYGDENDVRSEDEAFNSAIQAGRDTHIGPYESARDHINDEWWTHWEAITGQEGDRGTYFSCSC